MMCVQETKQPQGLSRPGSPPLDISHDGTLDRLDVELVVSIARKRAAIAVLMKEAVLRRDSVAVFALASEYFGIEVKHTVQ
jgi:hypothetical protein